MRQYVKGLCHHNPEEGRAADRLPRQIKGYLWNGNLRDGLSVIDALLDRLECVETDYPSMKALRKAAGEFEVYIHNYGWMIPNYAERRRYGERVSTGFVESAINTVVGKRFGKRQQMQWSKPGAHLMLQARTRAPRRHAQKEVRAVVSGIEDRRRGRQRRATRCLIAPEFLVLPMPGLLVPA